MKSFDKKLILAGRRPKRDSKETKYHFIMASKHYRSYIDATKKKDYELAGKHADAAQAHKKHLSEWHNDQFQHNAKHVKPATVHHYVPYKEGKKNLKKSVLVMRSRTK